MKQEHKAQVGGGWGARLANGYAYACAAICTLMGLLLLYGTFGEGRRMRQLLASPDALLGVSNHTVLVVAGVLHLVFGGYLLVTMDPLARGAMTGWAGLNYMIYRIGMASMGVTAPFPFLRAVAQNVGVAPRALDRAWWWVIVFYLAGACVLLMGEWCRWRRSMKKSFAERWREYRDTPTELVTAGQEKAGIGQAAPVSEAVQGDFKFTCPVCGQHIRCEMGYVGRQVHCPGCKKSVTVRKPDNLKMSCYFCQGHIEFPAHAIGQKLKCPHCNMDIGLKEPA